ncbi:hypothetical protein OAK90_00300 [bacterium]|nr:hypothetical protein [bacterium]
MKPEALYIVGRISALGSRPLLILLLKHFSGNTAAVSIATVFIVLALSLAISGFDSHRNFYKAYFAKKRKRGIKKLYANFISSVVFQILILILPIVGFFIFTQKGILIGLAAALYFASERLADESQRFLIFKTSRSEWGLRIFVKFLIQTVGVLLVCSSLTSTDSVFLGSLAALTLGNMVGYIKCVNVRYFPCRLKDILEGCRQSMVQANYWVLSMLTTSITYLDRIVVMILNQADVAVFTLVVSSLSLTQNFVEYFYLSFHRASMLQGKLSFGGIFMQGKIYFVIGSGLLVGVVLCVIMVKIYDAQHFNLGLILPMVVISQVAIAATLLAREIAYWALPPRHMIIIESSFFLIAVLSITALHALGYSYVHVLALLSLLYVIRVVAFATRAKQINI